jgi:GNAT superfamily N-acetyltransferase
MRKKNSRHFILQELDHYRTDLRAHTPEVRDAGLDVTFEYLERVPPDLLQTLGFASAHKIDEHTSCLVARHQNVPIGGKLFNLRGNAEHTFPFEHTYNFGKGHLYGFGLFVKPEFRGKGIGKLISAESVKLFVGKSDFMDIFIETNNYVSLRNFLQLGFYKVQKIIFLKMFGLQLAVKLDTPFKCRAYRYGMAAIRSAGSPIALGLPRLAKHLVAKAIWFKDELFLTSYVVHDAQAPGGAKGMCLCKHAPDTAFLSRIYPLGYRIQKESSFLRTKLRRRLDAVPPEFDFVLADTRWRYIRKSLDSFAAFTIIPKWVDRVNDSFNGFSDFTRAKNRNAYADVQAMKKYNYDFEFTKDESLCELFYSKMYVPYIRNRYQGEEIVLPYAAIRGEFKKGGVLLVKDTVTGKYLSGSIVNIQGDIFYPRKLGILNGDPELLKKEVLTALYISYFRFMEQNKLRRINVGGSRSFLNDGVLKYKEKWAPDIRFNLHHDNVLIFQLRGPSEAMDRFLLKNPFISMEKEKLIGNIFVPADADSDTDSLRKVYSIKGLPDVRIVRIPPQGNKNVFPLCESDAMLNML